MCDGSVPTGMRQGGQYVVVDYGKRKTLTQPISYIETLAELTKTRVPFVAVTLVEAVGSTPQDTGSKMLVTREGLVHGTVGGGRIEHQAIEFSQRMLTGEITESSKLVEWNLQRDVGMTCGGLVKLFFETYNRDDWHVVIFGAGHVAQALVKCLLTLECRITCIDTRADWLDKLSASERLTVICTDDTTKYVGQLRDIDYVVCMTMGHKTDRPVLEAIFRSGCMPCYLGVIGSRSKRGVLIRELMQDGIDKNLARQFVCPIGLPIGTNQPGEIAVSIVAQMLEHRDALRSGATQPP